MLPGLAPASSAMSRIETALKPRVENNNSAALRIASRILGFRVIGFAFCSPVLYVCTNYKVQSTNNLQVEEGVQPARFHQDSTQSPRRRSPFTGCYDRPCRSVSEQARAHPGALCRRRRG